MSVLRTPGTSRLRTVGPARPVPESAPSPAGALAPVALELRFLDDLNWLPVPWLARRFDSDDSFGWGTANGTVSDRRGGRNLPLFHSEIDLRGYRVLSRHICESNEFGIGFSGLLTDYNVRKGFAWQACRKGAQKSPYATTGAPADALVAKGQQILDDWRAESQWPAHSREAFKRARRDGETFGRFGRSGWGKLPWFRFFDPAQVGHPNGETDGPESFGIAKPPGDQAGPALAYYIWSVERPGYGEWEDADDILHARVNVDSDVKRGLPDFFPSAEALDGCQSLLRTMLATAIKQAGRAWIEKFPTALGEQVRAMIPQQAAQSYPSAIAGADVLPNRPYGPGRPDTYSQNQFRRSEVVKVEGNRIFEPGPTFAGASSYIEVEQAVLRACGVRWRFPEYFSGDASNNNMASAFVANSPFVTAVECEQETWSAAWEYPCAMKVLELARDAGLLSWEEWRQLDVHITPAAVATPEPDKDAQRVVALVGAKIICLDTARQELGKDPQHESEGVKKDAATAPQQQPPGAPGTPPGSAPPSGPGGGGGLFGEGRLSEEGQPPFPGAVFDRTKHRWVKGTPDPTDPKTNPNKVPALPRAPGAQSARTEPDPPPDRFARNTAGQVIVNADVQRWCEGTNEPAIARVVGGKALPDNEPMDVVLPPPPDAPGHGLELKTMVSNTHRQIRMKADAQKRKRKWRRDNGVPVHTVVIDDTGVYNALGPGKHDLSKRRVFYRRGFGSFKVDRMHEVEGGFAGLKELIALPTRALPPGAWKPKPAGGTGGGP